MAAATASVECGCPGAGRDFRERVAHDFPQHASKSPHVGCRGVAMRVESSAAPEAAEAEVVEEVDHLVADLEVQGYN